MAFLSLLFISADRLSIASPLGTVRFVQVLLVLLFAMMFLKNTIKVTKGVIVFFGVMLLYLSINVMVSHSPIRSTYYLVWFVYNSVFVFVLFSSYIYVRGFEKFERLYLLAYKIVSCYVILQFILGLFGISDPFFGTNFTLSVPRPYIWMYEPSYVATYLTPYFVYSGYNYLSNRMRNYKVDFLLSTVALVFTTSTAGYVVFFGFFLVMLMIHLLRLKIGFVVKFCLVSCLLLFFVFIISKLFVPQLFDYFMLRLFKYGIAGSAPVRYRKWFEALEVIKQNPIWGVGIGSYGLYINGDVKNVASNITLEIVAEIGIVGFAIILFGLLLLFSSCLLSECEQMESEKLKALIWSALFLFLILQANQNYMRLYLWLQLAVLYGFVLYVKSKNKKQKLLRVIGGRSYVHIIV
jgi:O-antigen ligase